MQKAAPGGRRGGGTSSRWSRKRIKRGEEEEGKKSSLFVSSRTRTFCSYFTCQSRKIRLIFISADRNSLINLCPNQNHKLPWLKPCTYASSPFLSSSQNWWHTNVINPLTVLLHSLDVSYPRVICRQLTGGYCEQRHFGAVWNLFVSFLQSGHRCITKSCGFRFFF